jgi:hypothetical protein
VDDLVEDQDYFDRIVAIDSDEHDGASDPDTMLDFNKTE